MADSKKKRFSIRKLIYNDKYLIIISIILAVAIWIVTSMNLSPETAKTITVPLTVDFSDSAAEQLGIKCFGDEKVDVEVTISCKKYRAKDITADDLNVYLQTNVVTSSGNFDVPIKVDTNENADFKVTSYYPTIYKGYFDVEDQKEMEVAINYTNSDFIEKGYTMGEPLLSESTVRVKGPRSYVSQVTSVQATINIEEKLKTTTAMDIVLNALDSYGSKVNYITIETGGENLTITIPVLKEMDLDVKADFLGKPSKVNINDFNVSYSVNRVKAGVLEDANITDAVVGNIDFSKLRPGRNTFTFNVKNLDSLVILDRVTEIDTVVTIPSDYKSKTISVNAGNVKVINVPKGYKANVVSISANKITAIGKKANLEDLSDNNVGLVVDLASLNKKKIKEGAASYKITPTIENSDTCWIYGDYSASVRITKI